MIDKKINVLFASLIIFAMIFSIPSVFAQSCTSESQCPNAGVPYCECNGAQKTYCIDGESWYKVDYRCDNPDGTGLHCVAGKSTSSQQSQYTCDNGASVWNNANEVSCSDGKDDDYDGTTDCADSDCSSLSSCNPCANVVCSSPPNYQCYDSTGTCSGGTCSYTYKAEGTPCDDSNSTTLNDKCTAGTCSGTAVPACSTGTISSTGCSCGGTIYYSGYCNNGVYSASAPLKSNGQTCVSNSECSSGYCVIGYCSATASTSVCGNNACEGNETSTSCPSDCAPTCPQGSISYSCKCGGTVYNSGYGYCCNGVYSSTQCATTAGTCVNGPIPGNGACICNGVSYSTGFCCNNVYSSSTPCSTNVPQCSEGAVPSSGCLCSGYAYTSGYCCKTALQSGLVWAGNTPCTQTCPTIAKSVSSSYSGVCCGGSASDCKGTWSGQWATDCQGYVCCIGTAQPLCTGSSYGDGAPTLTQCTLGSAISSSGCKCGGSNYYSGYCCGTGTGYYSSTSCPSTQCDKDNLWNCKTETECKTAGGWWTQYGSCSSQPQDKSSCIAASRYWCGSTDTSGYCQSSQCPQCSSAYSGYCYTEADCKGAGLNWCGNWCSTSTCPTCSSSQKYNCYTESSCTGAGGKWCASYGGGNNYCSDSCPTATGNCGDKVCSGNETISSCPSDCGTPTPEVGYCGWCGSSCSRVTSKSICPTVLPPSGYSCVEENSVCVKKAYDVKPITCPVPSKPPICGPNEVTKTKFDDKGCITGYECARSPVSDCPQEQSTFSCPAGEQLSKVTDAKGCVVGYSCIPQYGVARCPEFTVSKLTCRGTIVPIYTSTGCVVGYNCIPDGCKQEIDPKTQVTRVACETTVKCPTGLAEFESRCIVRGGRPITFTDFNGCKFIDCKFAGEEIINNPIQRYERCQSPEEINSVIDACKSTGLFPAISFEGSCKVVKCIQQQEARCRLPTPEVKTQLESQCSAKGLPIVKDIDSNGCAFYRCGETAEETCAKEVPSEAFEKCQVVGGEMVVKNDENGCVSYANCITRGDERDTYVEPIEKVPEATELLEIALKLEWLKVELNKLADQAANIATFYANRGDDDEERFNRVSSMFEAAADRLDEIRSDMRSRLDTMTVEDVIKIKRDIKRLKDVTLKDVVYMMLSNSDEVKETIQASKRISVATADIEDVEREGSDCGADDLCFDRSFRVCKPATFRPEQDAGPVITIIGLEESTCIVKARLSEEQTNLVTGVTPPYEMTCRFKEYSFGVHGPEDFIPNCEGSMVELIKQGAIG